MYQKYFLLDTETIEIFTVTHGWKISLFIVSYSTIYTSYF